MTQGFGYIFSPDDIKLFMEVFSVSHILDLQTDLNKMDLGETWWCYIEIWECFVIKVAPRSSGRTNVYQGEFSPWPYFS